MLKTHRNKREIAETFLDSYKDIKLLAPSFEKHEEYFQKLNQDIDYVMSRVFGITSNQRSTMTFIFRVHLLDHFAVFHRVAREYDKICGMMDMKLKPQKSTAGGVTDEEIERAREHPIKYLLEFNRSKKALCIFHDDTGNPNLHLNSEENWVYCFSCKKYADAIDVYRELHDVSFVEAVRKLS